MNPDSMSSDDLKQAWQAQPQPRITIDPGFLLNEVRRNQRRFAATIFWRDVREIGVALLMVPVWFYMGAAMSLPWTWYLTVPGLLWIAGFMFFDRTRHRRTPPEPGDSLRQWVDRSLAELDHQIRLLRGVFWWYLLPVALPISVFFAQTTWKLGRGGFPLLELVAFLAFLFAFEAAVFGFIYWLNQHAVRADLLPRRRELEALLHSLEDEQERPAP